MDDFELTPFEAEMINLHIMEEAQRQTQNSRQRSSQQNQYEPLDRSRDSPERDEVMLGSRTWWDFLSETNDSSAGNLFPSVIREIFNIALPELSETLTNNTRRIIRTHHISNNDAYNSARHAINNRSHENGSSCTNNSSTNNRSGISNSASSTSAANVKDVTCLICFESLFDRNKMATECGHLLCTTCMDHLIAAGQACPVCKRAVQRNRIFPIYF